MAFDFKKEFKEFYAPKKKPHIIDVPAMNFIAVRGKGGPNDEGGDYKKAIEFYNKGLILANKVDNDTVKGWLNNNLGNLYCYRKIDFHKGIKHYKEGLKYSIQHNDQYEIMFSKLNIVSSFIVISPFYG